MSNMHFLEKSASKKQRGGKPKFILPENPTDDDIKKFNKLLVRRAWREDNKDKVVQYKASKQKWVNNNREKQLEAVKSWYQNNKELLWKMVQCEVCGKYHRHKDRSRHAKQKFHLRAFEKAKQSEAQTLESQ